MPVQGLQLFGHGMVFVVFVLEKYFEPDWVKAIFVAVADFGIEEVGMGAQEVVVVIGNAYELVVGIVDETHLAHMAEEHFEELPSAFVGDTVAGDKNDSLLQYTLDSAFGVVH